MARRRTCRFTADGIKEIDYKDLDTLKAAPRPQGGPEAAVRALAGERRQQRELPGAALDRPGPQRLPRPLEAQRQEGRHQQRRGDLQGLGTGEWTV